jgi:hypothetical protein
MSEALPGCVLPRDLNSGAQRSSIVRLTTTTTGDARMRTGLLMCSPLPTQFNYRFSVVRLKATTNSFNHYLSFVSARRLQENQRPRVRASFEPTTMNGAVKARVADLPACAIS